VQFAPPQKTKQSDNNKASKKVSHLLPSYISLPSRGMSRERGEKQNTKAIKIKIPKKYEKRKEKV